MILNFKFVTTLLKCFTNKIVFMYVRNCHKYYRLGDNQSTGDSRKCVRVQGHIVMEHQWHAQSASESVGCSRSEIQNKAR